jgi:hypothetical protein
VFLVGKHLVLHRQKRAAGIDQIDARQAIFARHFLRAQMFLDGDRVVGAALHRRVIGDDHAFAAFDAADTGYQAAARDLVVVHAVRGERRQFEERRARIQQGIDTIARQELAARHMLLSRRVGAAECRLRGQRAQLIHELPRARDVVAKRLAAGAQRRLDRAHPRVSPKSSRPISMRRISEVPAPIS